MKMSDCGGRGPSCAAYYVFFAATNGRRDDAVDPAPLPELAVCRKGPPAARLQRARVGFDRSADDPAAPAPADAARRVPAHPGAAAWRRLLLRHALAARGARQRAAAAGAAA